MNSKNLIFIIFLYGLLISYFMGYSLYNNNQLRNSLVFVNQEEGETEKEEKNNNPENEIIYPTFFLDNKKTMIGCQCLIETIVLLVLIWCCMLKNAEQSIPQKEEFLSDVKDPNALKFSFWFHKKNDWFSEIYFGLIYFIIHAIIIFPLTLIFKFTSKNSYWYLWKNYWKNHFNNFGSCFIFLFIIFLFPSLVLMEIYIISERSKDDD